MLIDFTVENYRSIKDAVTLSSIATPSRAIARLSTSPARRHIKPDAEIAATFPIEGRGFELLPVLGLFGANASGKSNVLRALDLLLSLMTGGANPDFLAEQVIPYRLDPQAATRPTRFHLSMASHGDLFRYKLVLDAQRIWQERLEYVPATASTRSYRLLFQRAWQPYLNAYTWKNGSDFAGPHTEQEVELGQTDAFIYSLLKRLTIPVLKNFSRLRFHWRGLNLLGDDVDQHIAAYLAHQGDETRDRVVALMRRFDLGIDDLEITKSEAATEQEDEADLHQFAVTVRHHTAEGSVGIPFDEESPGTRRLFALAYQIIMGLDLGMLVLIDALGAQLHPNITHAIVRLFQHPKTNPNKAQLIFTTQESTLLQRNVLRRDQIWFTAKRDDGSTELYPLSDFRPRNDLAIDKAYLDGRFGAVPHLPDLEELLPDIQSIR